MRLVVVAAVVVAVHLLTAIGAWTGVGLLADDHHMIGAAWLRHHDQWTFASMFALDPVAAGVAVALYRPFNELLFWLEYPLFGTDAVGYHVVNSLLHCSTALLWFLLVRRLSGSAAAGLATAVLFVGWAGHSEATHWIAARTNVLSAFWLSVALLVHSRGLAAGRTVPRWLLLAVAALCAVLAIGTKESAVFVVPLAALLSWSATGGLPFGRRLARSAVLTLPMLVAAIAWLGWRAHNLGTWGSGTGYGWKPERIDGRTCSDWLAVLLAPAHHAYVPQAAGLALGVASTLLLVLAASSVRRAGMPTVLALGAALLGLGYTAGIGLERLDLPVLENVRYTYEPALGLCVLAGAGLARLPHRAFGAALVVVAALHTFVLHQNRQSWLRVSANYEQMRRDIVDVARATREPLRVFDAPGVHDGAFGFLNGHTEFLFLQKFAPPETDLRGAVSSSVEWVAVLHELAAAATQHVLAMRSFVVQWNDGRLDRFELDGRWPQQPWPDTTIGYARIARQRPFAGSQLPVQLLVTTAAPLQVRVAAKLGDHEWLGDPVPVAAGERPVPVQAWLPLAADLAPDLAVTIGLVLQRGEQTMRVPLGVTVPSQR